MKEYTKILHIIPSLQTGGAERLALDICIELNKRHNYEVMLFVLHDKINFPVQPFVKHVPASINLSITKKNKFNNTLLKNEIEKFKPHIIHTHLFEADIISRSINYPNAKWFSHLHDNMPQLENFSFKTLFKKNLFINFYEKQFFFNQCRLNNGNHFICISKDTLSYAKNTINKKFRYSLLHNAINFKKFFKRQNFIQKEVLSLINIGSFQAKKNQQFLVDVVKILKCKKNIKVELHLLGDGTLFENVKKKSILLELEEELIFHGNVKNVEDYLKKSDFYVHSAYYEPFGLVLIEAMASGLPVISLDGKGNRDIIEEGKNGFMVFEQNAEEFAEKIFKLWKDKKKMNEISQYANQYAEKYDIVSYVDALKLIYKL